MPFAGEGRVAVDQQRHAPAARGLGVAARSCLARIGPAATGLTNSRWLGLKHSERCTLCPGRRWSSRCCSPGGTSRRRGPEYRSGRRPRTRGRSPRALAHDVGQHVQPAAVGHAHDDLANALLAGLFDARSSSGIRLSAPSSEKLLAPMNFFWMNSSKITASVSRVRMRSCSRGESFDAVLGRLHALLQPVRTSGRRCA
jgi:hypothetical protein